LLIFWYINHIKIKGKEYEGLFAASDSDYGRTSVEKHTIATGSAHPIKSTQKRVVPSFFFTKTTGDDQGLEDGVITSLFNIPFTCLSTSFAKTSGSLRGGCFIGCADPVAIVQEVVNPNSKIDEEGELRTDLINLLEHSQEHLTPKQSSEDKRLLKEYEGLFAASDSDYGRTHRSGSFHPYFSPRRQAMTKDLRME
jgi:hypothetical protein